MIRIGVLLAALASGSRYPDPAVDPAQSAAHGSAVGPGPIHTPFHEQRIQALGRTFEQYRDDAAKGTLLVVDGGYTAM